MVLLPKRGPPWKVMVEAYFWQTQCMSHSYPSTLSGSSCQTVLLWVEISSCTTLTHQLWLIVLVMVSAHDLLVLHSSLWSSVHHTSVMYHPNTNAHVVKGPVI